MNRKIDLEESFLCLAAGIIMAIAIIAIMCGDGSKGILDLF